MGKLVKYINKTPRVLSKKLKKFHITAKKKVDDIGNRIADYGEELDLADDNS